MDVVLADQLGGDGFVHRALQRLALADELAAHIDEGGVRAHCEAGDQAALDQGMGSWRRMSRSLQVPGSDSSALTTR